MVCRLSVVWAEGREEWELLSFANSSLPEAVRKVVRPDPEGGTNGEKVVDVCRKVVGRGCLAYIKIPRWACRSELRTVDTNVRWNWNAEKYLSWVSVKSGGIGSRPKVRRSRPWPTAVKGLACLVHAKPISPLPFGKGLYIWTCTIGTSSRAVYLCSENDFYILSCLWL